MSTAQQWLLLLKVHVKMMRVKAGVAASRSKLMSATILGFLASYAIAAYLLFREGLEYVAALPAACVMLAGCAVIAGGTLIVTVALVLVAEPALLVAVTV